jgi:hypothetical protein
MKVSNSGMPQWDNTGGTAGEDVRDLMVELTTVNPASI